MFFLPQQSQRTETMQKKIEKHLRKCREMQKRFEAMQKRLRQCRND
jgi:chaperonin cofactor prefoldin